MEYIHQQQLHQQINKMKIFFVFLFFLLTSCLFEKSVTWVNINNKSNFRIDSVNVWINEHKIKFGNIQINEIVKKATNTDSINANHDVVYYFEVYIKDSLRIKKYIYSNDLGYVPPEFSVMVTDSLIIVQDNKKK